MKGAMKFGVLALLLVSLVASAFAFHGRAFGNEAAKEALESGDYTAWKEAMTAGLTEERFNQMRERHTQMEERMSEMRAKMEDRQVVIDAACEEADISKLSEINCPMLEEIDETNFETFCELHQAKQDKDFEKVKELSEELGLNLGRGFGMKGMPRMGMRHRFDLE